MENCNFTNRYTGLSTKLGLFFLCPHHVQEHGGGVRHSNRGSLLACSQSGLNSADIDELSADHAHQRLQQLMQNGSLCIYNWPLYSERTFVALLSTCHGFGCGFRRYPLFQSSLSATFILHELLTHRSSQDHIIRSKCFSRYENKFSSAAVWKLFTHCKGNKLHNLAKIGEPSPVFRYFLCSRKENKI